MTGSLPWRRAWITGAGKGIGRALALALAARGVQVVVSARNRDDLDSLVEEAGGLSGAVRAWPLDVTDGAAVAAAFAGIEADAGAIDLAVLNAGTYLRFGARDFSSAAFRDQLEVNLMGVVHGLEALLPAFLERGAGRIAVVSSLAGYRGLPMAAGYGAGKAALINLCESLYPECRAAGVGLSLVNPGFVKTSMTDKNAFPMPFLMAPEAAVDAMIKGLARGRFEITFPWQFAVIMKALRLLPDWLFFRLTRGMV